MEQHQVLIRVSAGLVIAAGVAPGVVRFYGQPPPGQNVEAAVGAVAFGCVIALPGVLAVLAAHDRPALLLPAALWLVPLSFISFALVTLPLLIPAVLLLRAYAQVAHRGSGWRAAATTLSVFLLMVAAFLTLLLGHDAREYVADGVVYGISDVVTYGEAAAALALTSAAGVVGWWLAAPRTV